MSDDSRQLLLRYSRDRSDAAFRELVARHAPLVHATALRRLNGDAAAAEDVTQEVFTLLARKASGLRDVILSGWLYRQTCRRAANHVRAERRRKRREKIAMDLFPLTQEAAAGGLARDLDEAMLSLSAQDRDALVLRFLEGQPFSAVGRKLGVTEEAARKRVRRALDRLEGNLRRKGIASGGAGLGGVLSGFAAPALPDAMISRVSAKALESSSVAAPVVMGGYLKSLAAGVIAASLVAVPVLAFQRRDVGKSPQESGRVATAPQDRRQERAGAAAVDDSSLEAIIQRLKHIEAGPGGVFSSLRRDELLERIEIGRIPEFMALAKEKLSGPEKSAIYEPLLKRWMERAPDDAITFVLEEDVVGELREWTGTNILANFFDQWVRGDSASAKEWLLRQWNHEGLGGTAFQGTLRSHLANKIGEKIFLDQGADVLAGFIRGIPDEEGRAEALRFLTADSAYYNQVRMRDRKIRLEALAFLDTLPEPQADELTRRLAKVWAEAHPEEILDVMATVDAETRFHLALGRLAARSEPGERTPIRGQGYRQNREQIIDTHDREQATLQAGFDAGLPREEIFHALAAVLVERVSREEFFDWLELHAHEADFDDLIMSRARKEVVASGWSGNRFPELAAMEWASLLSDETQRVWFSRAAFRKWLVRNPEGVAAMPEDLRLDPAAVAEFHRILEEPE